ncbi:Uncharacterized protein APZ42_007300 [Daphnia magna]|uniref:Uncharacterized protein n=1 Tax=Daphnia magna TaxID=35525 RepID=A0A162D273_9CRUS|nr:Uncharacterized protein APZ42_007300 [Daphnia magna]
MKKLITSNDPLVQTQTSVANCSQCSKYVNGSSTRIFRYQFHLGNLRSHRTINGHRPDWATLSSIRQKMSHPKNRKIRSSSLSRRSKKQHFSFEYKNPHQIKTLSAAAIIALHTQHSFNGKTLPVIPTITRRDINDASLRNKMSEPPSQETNLKMKTTAVTPTTTITTKPTTTAVKTAATTSKIYNNHHIKTNSNHNHKTNFNHETNHNYKTHHNHKNHHNYKTHRHYKTNNTQTNGNNKITTNNHNKIDD